jgi:Tol biopolymer transport system component/tRNA A-37 threonylcarbamoyl transferase component Bud32
MAPLNAGSQLGPYEILSPIGAGGMGEVYKARDSRLNRTVAIKVLSHQMVDVTELKQRFEREAQTVAGLNHPHICTLYDIGRQGAVDYLVMEYLDGETVAQRLERGPMPIDLVLKYAVQIADALDKAHRQGITHRDLKPSNIMLTKSGAKLLDFGLAKLRQETPETTLSALPTNAAVTAQGTILGTLQYMAPEQVEGLEADSRTDIFAFGALLYEMATGRKAFEGKSQASLIAAILDREPAPISSLLPATPRQLDHVIRRCLAKTPDERWQTALDLQFELKWIAQDLSQSEVIRDAPAAPAETRGGRSVSWMWVVFAVILGAIAAAGAGWMFKPDNPGRGVRIARLNVTVPRGWQYADVDQPELALSSDGTMLAFVAEKDNTAQLLLRSLDALESKPLPGTQGAEDPFFSPDGEWIGFFASGKLKKVSVSGGTVQTLCDVADPRGGTWSADDWVYFAPNNLSGIYKIPASGGTPQQVTTLDRTKGEVSHRYPLTIRGGKALLFTVWTGPGSDERHVHAQLLPSGERHVLMDGAETGRYVSTGHLVYAHNDALMAVRMDPNTLKIAGSAPVRLAETPRTANEAGLWAFSDSGVLAYISGQAGRLQRRMVWVDRKGNIEPIATPLQNYTNVKLSPDNRYAAVQVEAGTIGIWLFDFVRSTLTPLTQNGSSQAMVWSADGKHVAYRGTRMGFRNVFWKAVDGTSEEERLTTSNLTQTPSSASPDGKWLAYNENHPETRGDMWLMPLEGERKAQLFLKTPSGEGNVQFSPDSKWIAYESDESGRNEIYVSPLAGPKTKTQISTGGGNEPLWSPNGRELFYLDGNKMMAVDVVTQPSFSAGTPRMLFEGSFTTSPNATTAYDISKDGQRFLRVQAMQSEPPVTQIDIVLNWFQELK